MNNRYPLSSWEEKPNPSPIHSADGSATIEQVENRIFPKIVQLSSAIRPLMRIESCS